MGVWQAALLDVVAAGQESYIFLQHCCFPMAGGRDFFTSGSVIELRRYKGRCSFFVVSFAPLR